MSKDRDMNELKKQFDSMVESFRYIMVDEIPDIDLYMDQVTTFMEQRLSPYARDPESDKILTKTMINNYTKNGVLIPPVKKKYSRDHMILLLLIYYMKSFLSLSDIGTVLQPLRDNYTKEGRELKEKAGRKKEKEEKEEEPVYGSLQDIYQKVVSELSGQLSRISEQTATDFELAGASFADYPEEERKVLTKFDLICRMSAEIYIKKLFIERMIDEESGKGPENE